jgi:hypothetical protein
LGDIVYTWATGDPTVVSATQNFAIAGQLYCVIELGAGPDAIVKNYCTGTQAARDTRRL